MDCDNKALISIAGTTGECRSFDVIIIIDMAIFGLERVAFLCFLIVNVTHSDRQYCTYEYINKMLKLLKLVLV